MLLAGQTALDPGGKVTGDTLPRPVREARASPLHRPARGRGTPADLARVTVYATDVAAYRARAAELGRTWRELASRDDPAMAVGGSYGSGTKGRWWNWTGSPYTT